MPKTVNINIRCSAELRDKLNAIAKQLQRTQSDTLRYVIMTIFTIDPNPAIPLDEQIANREFVVTACNAHRHLLECAHLLRELGEISEVWEVVKRQCGTECFDKARAAIAKAKGM